MGFIEEAGAAQYLRDARIAPIYEGTTGIQAGDLVGRKLSMDNGSVMTELIQEMSAVEDRLGSDNADLPAIRESLAGGIRALEDATDWVLQTIRRDPNAALAASVNYMMLTGYVCGGWQMACAALAARAGLGSGADDADFAGPRSRPRGSMPSRSCPTRPRCSRSSGAAHSGLLVKHDSAFLGARFDVAALGTALPL
jgi:acyl-CoA dehydrogenase